MDYNIFNEIFGADWHLDKKAMRDKALNDYIAGKITKKQLDEKMEQLKRD